MERQNLSIIQVSYLSILNKLLIVFDVPVQFILLPLVQ